MRQRWSLRPAALLIGAFAACGGDDGGGGPVDPNSPPTDLLFRVAGGGGNVNDRFSSDLWVHGAYAYTGTWGGSPRDGSVGDVVKIWRLTAAGAPVLTDSIEVPGGSTIVSDIEVSDDGSLLMYSVEQGKENGGGIHLYSLDDPKNPALLNQTSVPSGVHTATFGVIDGRRYAFAAKNPPDPALLIYDVTNPITVGLAATVPVPENYGIHDTFVRDGIAFVFVWDDGVIIYDVGNGLRGGSPTDPVEVSRLRTAANDVPGGPAAHNGWWFHNPARSERRYLFVGQEGPQTMGESSSGDIHVLDVSDLANPREVAFFHLAGAGAHNFWMDESRQILYAAYYNAGVIALDVSGELRGDLGGRLIGQIRPGGIGNTFTWGVHLKGSSLYASDMLSGLWQLKLE